MMDSFNLGVTDLSWGFNGNILLASSNDGKVVVMHFQKGVLGTPCSEAEKRIILEQMYGRTVLDEYVQNKRCQNSDLKNLSSVSAEIETVTTEQKQEQTKSTTGKLKIKPIMMKVYSTNATIDP